MFEWLTASSFQLVVLGSVKMIFKILLLDKKSGWWWKLSIKMFLKLWHCQIFWYLFEVFKIIILHSFYSIWFKKYVFFSAKIWFVKIWTRIVKYKLQVVKSNPEHRMINLNYLMDHILYWIFKISLSISSKNIKQ